jgi:glycine/sarcosine N-methyltransferase
VTRSNAEFYDPLAEVYHLIFEDWDASIARQARIVNGLLRAELGEGTFRILDCACGVGTQALGLAQCGHHVTGSDLSAGAVERARREARQRGLEIPFLVADMTDLGAVADGEFDAVVALDNALPHLEREPLKAAVCAMRAKVRAGGLLLASTRDYDRAIVERPVVQGPEFYGREGERRILHQVWEWTDGEWIRIHLYITTQEGEGWNERHFVGEYRAVLRGEITRSLEEAEFTSVRWLMPQESGFFQPIVMARAE